MIVINKRLRSSIAAFVMSSLFLPSIAFSATLATEVARPSGAEDSAGNVHLAFFDTSSEETIYALYSASGDVLIAPTAISPGSDCEGAPYLALLSDDQAIIVCESDEELFFMRVDASQDDQNGDAADPGDILITSDYLDSSLSKHPSLAVDSTDRIHLVAEEENNAIYYTVLDEDGTDEFIVDVGAYGDYHANPSIALDSDGNAHISWTDEEEFSTSDHELIYVMADGSNGDVLIAPTLLTADDDNRAKHSSILVNDSDQVSIVFAEQNGGADFYADVDIYLIGLDPSADDQNGDDADTGDANFLTTPQTRISADDGKMSYYVRAYRAADGNIDVIWSNNNASDLDSSGPGCDDDEYAVQYMRVSDTGGTVRSEQTLTSSGGCYTYNNYYFALNDVAYVLEYNTDTGDEDLNTIALPSPDDDGGQGAGSNQVARVARCTEMRAGGSGVVGARGVPPTLA